MLFSKLAQKPKLKDNMEWTQDYSSPLASLGLLEGRTLEQRLDPQIGQTLLWTPSVWVLCVFGTPFPLVWLGPLDVFGTQVINWIELLLDPRRGQIILSGSLTLPISIYSGLNFTS